MLPSVLNANAPECVITRTNPAGASHVPDGPQEARQEAADAGHALRQHREAAADKVLEIMLVELPAAQRASERLWLAVVPPRGGDGCARRAC